MPKDILQVGPLQWGWITFLFAHRRVADDVLPEQVRDVLHIAPVLRVAVLQPKNTRRDIGRHVVTGGGFPISLHIRQTPPPRLSVGAAMMWISLIALVMSIAIVFADHTPPPV